MFGLLCFGSMLFTAAAALEFHQFEGEEYHVNINTLRLAPDGHELHFIQDAKDNVFEWNPSLKKYFYHEIIKNHNEKGHHHQTVFDFPAGVPPDTLQTDDAGHELIEILNTRVRGDDDDYFFYLIIFFLIRCLPPSSFPFLLLSLLLHWQLATFKFCFVLFK